MQGMIEGLETRTLLSSSLPTPAATVSADVSALAAAAKVAVADVTHCTRSPPRTPRP